MNFFKSIRDWWMHRHTMRACRDAGLEVSAMSKEERAELWESGMRRVYPKGWWECGNHSRNFKVPAAKGRNCPLCDSAEPR